MHSVAEVYLRDVLASDLPVHFEHQSDPESARLSITAPRDRAAFDAHWTKILEDSAAVVQTIVADGEVAGSAFCFLHDNKREVGYRIGREHWGRGIASAALRLLLAEVAERPLYATVAEHNPASLRVLEKCGFRRIGVERDDEAIMHVLRLD
jgi:RimJ/RimL family protein N-acetyltransferase